jgi:autotransporter-associated beta strand protein
LQVTFLLLAALALILVHAETVGALTATASAGSVTFSGSITTTGGNHASGNGGNGGTVSITANSGGSVGAITANGGNGTNNTRGSGANITINTNSTFTAASTIASVRGSGNNGGAGGSFTKQGSGVLILTGTNTWTGNMTISGGSVRTDEEVRNSTTGNFGNSAASVILNGGGVDFGTNSTTATTRTLSVQANGGKIDAYGAARTASNPITATGAYILQVGGTTSAGAEGQDLTLSGVISNGTGTLSLEKVNSSTVVLSGANTYKGNTTVTAGILRLGAAGVIANTSKIDMNGGLFNTGSGVGYTEQVGNLIVTENSTIALGTGSHTLTFANSSGETWTANKRIVITGWTTAGAWGTDVGNAGDIIVTGSGLTAGQLAQISFYDGSNYWSAKFHPTNTTEVVPNAICGSVALSSTTPSQAAGRCKCRRCKTSIIAYGCYSY